jgi:signal transduction histidine kinase
MEDGAKVMRSAAWRVSLWAALGFACGTMLVFVFLQQFVADDIQRRTDTWLTGEVEWLGDVERLSPDNAFYRRVIGTNDSAFLLQTARDGSLSFWVGPAGDGHAYLESLRNSLLVPGSPRDFRVRGSTTPFRVVFARRGDGSNLYLGLSERDDLRVLRSLRIRFMLLWLTIVWLGCAIVFYSTRRVLGRIREITDAASRIGEEDLSSRVPATRRNDEVAQLAITLNRMLDRIERSVHQVHTITGSLAHDLRSPLTAVRARLEMALSATTREGESELIVSAIDDMDRLSDFLNKWLDVAEANANALRLHRKEIDLDEILRVMIHLYEPSMSERGLQIHLASAGKVTIAADAALLHRMLANLFENELKHLPPSCTVEISLKFSGGGAKLVIEDDGPGFDSEINDSMFERRVKGRNSNGYGLGLAFVEAVVRAHGGTVHACNREAGGARLAIVFPAAEKPTGDIHPSVAAVSSD